jgi:hypothetical protein
VGKCGDRCDPEDHREDNAAVAVNSYRTFLLLDVIEDDRRHNLDEERKTSNVLARIKTSSRVMYGSGGSWLSMAKRYAISVSIEVIAMLT